MANEKTILIADDSEAIRLLYKNELENRGFSIIEAQNGQEALDTALAQKPDLILLDVVMPEMEGVEVLKQLRNDSWGQHVPVLMLTQMDDMAHIAEATAAMAQGYFVKKDTEPSQIADDIEERLTNT